MEEIIPKTILQSEALQKYILDVSAYPREHDQLKEIREATKIKYGKGFLQCISVDEAQFLSLILKLVNAKNTLEIGVFTGYSLLMTALAIPINGKITAIDINKEAYEIGLPFIQKAGMEHKINFIQSHAISVLNQMSLNKIEGKEEFDFVFVDADKENYMEYHKHAINLVKIGGVIAYDNTLWIGFVARQENEVPELFRTDRKAILEFNNYIVSDSRIDVSLLSIGDGLTLCRRIC